MTTLPVLDRCGTSPTSLYLAVADFGNGRGETKSFPNLHRAQGWAAELADHASSYGVQCGIDIFALIRTNHIEFHRLPFMDVAEEREEVCHG